MEVFADTKSPEALINERSFKNLPQHERHGDERLGSFQLEG